LTPAFAASVEFAAVGEGVVTLGESMGCSALEVPPRVVSGACPTLSFGPLVLALMPDGDFGSTDGGCFSAASGTCCAQAIPLTNTNADDVAKQNERIARFIMRILSTSVR
jgi:hypothetical protein